jgi:DNA-binding IclR family transcriptional regulator
MVSALGKRLPAHCTGVGKMLLSDLGPEALDALFPRQVPLTTMTPNSISSHARLRTELAVIRDKGLSFDDAESNEDVHCVAAGVRDQTGVMVAAMSISGPTLRWDEPSRDRWSVLVREGADRLSESLGYRRAAAS